MSEKSKRGFIDKLNVFKRLKELEEAEQEYDEYMSYIADSFMVIEQRFKERTEELRELNTKLKQIITADTPYSLDLDEEWDN